MKDYKLLDSGNGRRLEQFGKYIVDRPDPEVMWEKTLPQVKWDSADAKFYNNWNSRIDLSKPWQVKYDGLTINLKLTPFKHIGIFPEQEFEWEIIKNQLKTVNGKKVLSLFGYTGVASLVALQNNAEVTHVDASRPAISWFRENQKSSNLLNKPCRIIIDDCLKFAEKEFNRGKKYDGIIMDPPSYGHGPKGEVWNFSKDFAKLVAVSVKLLTDNPLFLIINAYSVSVSPTTIANLIREKLADKKGEVLSGELSLKEESSGKILTTGIYTIWRKLD